MNLTSIFENIYENKKWGINFANMGSSGPGSHISQVKEYMLILQEFLDNNNVKSVIDIGCGDFQFMRHMNLKNVQYTGIDCVEKLIIFNKKHFEKENITFLHRELSEHEFDFAELYLIKDVLQHLSNDIICDFLDYIVIQKLAKYIIITNCSNQDFDNQDVESIGQTRPLNAKLFPLKKYNPVVLKEYNGKQVSLIIIS